MALLRGANRPLLTRLVEQEVAAEVQEAPRSSVDIDFRSHRVIQCAGELAALDEDEVKGFEFCCKPATNVEAFGISFSNCFEVIGNLAFCVLPSISVFWTST